MNETDDATQLSATVANWPSSDFIEYSSI